MGLCASKRQESANRAAVSPLIRAVLAISALALSLGLPAAASAAPVNAGGQPHIALAARLAGDDSRVRLVLDFEHRPEFTVRYLANPDRVVIDLPETIFAFPAEALTARGLVSDVRYGKSGEGRARMVLGLAAPARFDLAETSEEVSGTLHRLVFDAAVISREAFSDQVVASNWAESLPPAGQTSAADKIARTLTIVIDPGHGGIDGGAEGPGGSMEKQVTLAFAEAFKRALEKQDGIRVAMTRTDDRFLSLSARVRKAREEQADLLVSMHADSISVSSLRGATVYTLSEKASDALSQSIAEQENRTDTIVGANLEDAPEAVTAILVDLARTETRVFSTGLAEQVINSFEGQVKLINNPHRYAGFRVLQAPDVPSVLVELGYLSNSEDEKQFSDEAWRQKIAGLLAQSVRKYRETILAGRR